VDDPHRPVCALRRFLLQLLWRVVAKEGHPEEEAEMNKQKKMNILFLPLKGLSALVRSPFSFSLFLSLFLPKGPHKAS
jgi:hypothetical protein